MGRELVGLVVVLVVATAAVAASAQPDLHGIALGMTPAQASDAAHLPCQTPQYSSDLSCKDTHDGSAYRVMFSAGEPSIALSVQHEFCSPASQTAVLGDALALLDVGRDRVHVDPNGFYIDLAGDNEAILNADDGTCPSGGRHYVLLIRSDGLIKMSSQKALQRAKAVR